MKAFLSAVSLSLLTTCASAPVAAQNGLPDNCGPTEFIQKDLSEKYKEVVQVAGLVKQGDTLAIMEVWGNVDTGTWTIVYNYPTNITCVMGDGINFEVKPPEPGGEPA